MADTSLKDPSFCQLVAEVRRRYPARLVAVEDPNPADPHTVTFIRAQDGEELFTVRTEGNEPGRYVIVREETTVPHCLIQGVLWSIRDGLRQRHR